VEGDALSDPASRAVHDAYHRFLRAGVWSLKVCFAALCQMAGRLVSTKRLTIYLGELGRQDSTRQAGSSVSPPREYSSVESSRAHRCAR